MRRILAVGAVCATVTAATVSLSMTNATAATAAVRLGGADRIDTAILISQNEYPPDGASAIVLARSDDFPDALAGTPLAVAKHAPILLTPPTSLDSRTAAEMARVAPAGATVYVLGGTGAISATVASQISRLGFHVLRYGGANRYGTAAAIAAALPGRTTAFLATGITYSYGLLAGVAAAQNTGVVLLTTDTSMPAETKQYLAAHPLAEVAVGRGAATAAPTALAVVDSDQYTTATLLAREFLPEASSVAMASGATFPDALAGGAHIAAHGGALLLSPPTVIPSTVSQYVADHADVTGAYIYGGPGAISSAVESSLNTILGGPTPAPGGSGYGDGTYRVGTDIPPGTYRTRNNSSGCYWKRMSDFSGNLDSILANDFTNDHTVVTILPGDVGFATDGCGTWTSDLSAITSSPDSPFGDGMWIVGTDVAAGTWSAPGGPDCYWKRVSSFTGDGDSIIANDFGTTAPIVTIDPADAGFASQGCGTWSRG